MSVLGTIGREVADFMSWNTMTKGKRSRKAMATSSESPKRVGSDEAELVPLKKRRSSPSKSPTLSPENMDTEASKKLINGVFYSPDDFHGLSLLAAAACINTQQDVVASNNKEETQAQNACSESGKQLQDDVCVELADVSSKVDRLHWDLNVPMEEWERPIVSSLDKDDGVAVSKDDEEIPIDSSTIAVITTSLDKDDGVTVSKDDEEISDAETPMMKKLLDDLDLFVETSEKMAESEGGYETEKNIDSSTLAVITTSLDNDDGVTVSKDDEEFSDAETVVLDDLDQVFIAEECYVSKSEETSDENQKTSEKVAEPQDGYETEKHIDSSSTFAILTMPLDEDGLAVSKDEESDAETVQLDDLDLVENAELECHTSKSSSEENKTSAAEELNHKDDIEETSKEVAETSKEPDRVVDSSMLDIQAMPLDEDGLAVSGDKKTDVEAVPPVDQVENAEECFVSKPEDNTVEAPRKLTEPEDSFESLSEEGELKEWQENEHVDYESDQEFFTDMNSVHDDADNNADDGFGENLSNQDSAERHEKTYDAPNFRDQRDDRHYKGYNPDFRGRGRYHPYQSGYRGRGRGPNRPRMSSGPNSRTKFYQKPHYNDSNHAERDDRYNGEGDRNRQMAYWEPRRYDGPPMEDNGPSRPRNNGAFHKQAMDYPSKNMHRPAGWNRYQNDRRNFRGRNFHNGRGGGFRKPSFADDYEDGYRSPPPPPPPPSRGRFSSPPRSFRGDEGGFRPRKPYNNGFRQDKRLDSGEGFKPEDGSYLRNRRPPFNDGFRGEQGGYKSFRPDW